MLTYYLAGMNLVDMLAYDFRTDEINYIRTKTRNTKTGIILHHSQSRRKPDLSSKNT